MIAGLGKVLLVVLIVYFEYLKNNLKTRKYPSRMRTARLPSVHASVSSPDVGTGWEAGPGGLMSKGEGAGGFHALCPGIPCLMSKGEGQKWSTWGWVGREGRWGRVMMSGRGGLHSWVQCTMGNGHIGTSHEQNDRHD